MQNRSSPPKYGAEGPPGGPDAWARQRAQGNQSNMQRMLGAVASMNPQMRAAMEAKRAQQQSMSQPRPWDQVQRAVWPGQGQGQPQPPGPPPAPPSGASMMPNTNAPPPPMPSAEPPQQSMRPQWMQQMGERARQMPEQQTGMAGLGAAAGKINQMRKAQALRGGGGGRGAGNMQEL